MVVTKEEKIVCLIFSYYICTLKVKCNINWQISILFKIIYVVDRIVFFAALYWIKNFWPYKKHFRFFVKKVEFWTKNVLLGVLKLLLKDLKKLRIVNARAFTRQK